MSEGRVTLHEGVVYGTAGAGGRDLRCDVFVPPDAKEDLTCPRSTFPRKNSAACPKRARLTNARRARSIAPTVRRSTASATRKLAQNVLEDFARPDHV